jgi:ComF family protein
MFPIAIAQLRRMLDLVLPQHCAGCRAAGDVFCDECSSALAVAPGIVRESDTGDLSIVALGPYEGRLRNAVLAVKFRGARSAAGRIGEWLAVKIPWDIDAIVPVPLHRDRQRERGYNQAGDIARGLAGASRIALIEEALARRRPTLPQSSLDAATREKNIAGAFGPGPMAHRVRDLRVLLVDDVITTGATARECAEVLRRCGALAVYLSSAALRL